MTSRPTLVWWAGVKAASGVRGETPVPGSALGAERRTVLLMVLKEVAVLALLGIALGLPSGYGLGRLVESQLYGLTARDPLTFAVATAVLVVSAALAGYVPAARATRVDPMVALRYE